jgi:hypothetical protein
MFAYPPQAVFDRVVPKSKIYAHARPSRAVRDRFVAQVGQIVWRYKLAPETVNLPSRPGVTEIQVFGLTLRTNEVDPTILRTIDRAIPFPILFELQHEGRVRGAAAYKRPSDADAARWVVDEYFDGPWRPADAPRPALPVALDLGSLYEQMLRSYIEHGPRPGESLAEQVARVSASRRLAKDCERLEARMRKELQFNRKVELNAELHALRKELEGLESR